jgi:hypothetical protein
MEKRKASPQRAQRAAEENLKMNSFQEGMSWKEFREGIGSKTFFLSTDPFMISWISFFPEKY